MAPSDSERRPRQGAPRKTVTHAEVYTGAPAAASERPPPYNLDAERACLGAVLLSPEALATVREIITPSDLYATGHSAIYGAMLALADRAEPVDTITLCGELERTRKLKVAGGRAGVEDLTRQVPGLDNAAHYARMLRDLAHRRRALGATLAAAQRLREDPDVDPGALLGPVQAALAECARTPGCRPLGIAARDLMALSLPAPSYVVKDLLPEGLSLLVGPPKLGKS
jgi:hypothetical protein